MNPIIHTPSFSIIVPVYNVERYMSHCLDSIVSQSFSDFECILIDDGTTDDCFSVCEKYASADSRIRAIHQENKGAAATRNEGGKNVCSNYVVFADSDDELEENCLASLMAVPQNIDLVIAGTKNYNVDGTIHHIKSYDSCTYESICMNIVCKFLDNKAIEGPHSKRFRFSVIQMFNIQFPADMKLGEDNCFVASYLCRCNNVALIPDTPYRYYKYQHETLTTFNFNYLKNMQKAEYALSDILTERFQEIKESTTLLKRRFRNYYYSVLKKISSRGNCLKKIFFLRKIFSEPEYEEFIPDMASLAQSESSYIRYALREKAAFLLILITSLYKTKQLFCSKA